MSTAGSNLLQPLFVGTRPLSHFVLHMLSLFRKLPSLVLVAVRSLGFKLVRFGKLFIIHYPYAAVLMASIIICELVVSRAYIYSCAWPRIVDFSDPTSGDNYGTVDAWEPAEVHIAVIADPQLTDAYAYDQESGILLYLTEIISDIYMKRNYRLLQQVLHPQHVIFAGDMMDGGREWKDDRYQRELSRLQVIFTKLDSKITTIGVPGNHDIGFGDTVVDYAYQRFKSTFGTMNSVVTIANHRIICLDTVSLSSKRDTPAKLEAVKFMEEFEVVPSAMRNTKNILISHVPLYRPPHSDCGPRRVAKPITNMYGFQFQNLIQAQLTHEILEKFKPELIISGDDHDDCVYTHVYQNVTSIEHSVGTFSWLQGASYPSFGVLSLRSAGAPPLYHNAPSVQLDICSLPAQKYIYSLYISLLGIGTLWSAVSASIASFKQQQGYVAMQEGPGLPSNHRTLKISRRAGTLRRLIVLVDDAPTFVNLD
ncbi:hypothetical protein BASA81_007654 [Batrachochytrium salamandrivorans]|nr:hypothetical protein BASA81_007654 [Batrachochytrium salamandrivorans]